MFKKQSHDIDHIYLIEEAELTDSGFPVIMGVNDIPEDMIAFSDACIHGCKGKWVHFFEEDDKFQRLWTDPHKYLDLLRQADGIVEPDFSMFIDDPMPLQIYNLYRSRALGFWISTQGIKVMPNAGWAAPETFNWVWDGIPQHSTVAISTCGKMKDEAKELYLMGLEYMVKVLEPKNIVCVGKPIPCDYDIIYFESKGQKMEDRKEIIRLEENKRQWFAQQRMIKVKPA